MNCIVIDNDSRAREEMKQNIKNVPNLEMIGSFETALKANEFLLENDVDLMFTEVELPGLNGFDFVRSLKNPPQVIVTTSDEKHAVEAFELDVLDFLAKPIKMDRFIRAINKAEGVLRMHDEPSAIDYNEDFIFVKSERKYVKLNYNDIYFIEGLKDYVILHANKGKFMTAMNVKTVHRRLPNPTFFRTSKSYIVNVNHIDEIDGEDVIVQDTRIPIGRSYREKFVHRFVQKRLIRR
ncbi:MAG: LytTR family DNA-binding domain-containing protein [Candidatus Delongbacteria bacterium]|jgi:DNA-binding LytR/AlgR family response regulator|nr:LytTR family DNA-binding domain-containing protein [Candidatus Delongbacteria bacterium]